MQIFGKKTKGSSKKKQQGNSGGNVVQSIQNRQPIGNRAMAGKKKGNKQLNSVAAGKYDTNFAGLDNEAKLTKLHELALYLESKEALKEMTEEDMDLRATYDSVLQQATEDDEFLELLKEKTSQSAKEFKKFKYASMDEFNKADEEEHGIYQTHEELQASNRRGGHNMIKNIGYSKKGDDLNGYLMMMKRAGDLVSSDLRGQKFREETAIDKGVTVDFDNEHDNFITNVSSGKEALSAARNHATYSTHGEVKEFITQHRREIADNYKLPHGEGHLANLAKALRESKKGGFGANSERFEQVEQKIETVISQFSTKLDKEDIMNTQEIIEHVRKDYKELEEVCEIYVNRKVHTTNGKNRQAIVAQILEYVKKDTETMVSYVARFKFIPQEERFQDISELIEKGRQRKLVIKEEKEKELGHVGGSASDLIVLKKGDLTDENTSGYFKEEEFVEGGEERDALLKIYQKLRKEMDFNDEAACKEIEDKIKDKINKDERAENISTGLKKHSKYLKDENVTKFLDMLMKKAKLYSTSRKNLVKAGVKFKEGSSINISKRNVAASRLANLLGVGELIAQSETVELQGENGSKKGNLMQAAKGKDIDDVTMELYQKAIEEKRFKENEEKFISPEEMKQLVSAQFMKSLNCLQMLDTLMGQVDRHEANFMVNVENGKLGSVQGIDNDLAFGHDMTFRTKKAALNKSHYTEEDWKEARLKLPYMDKAFAMRLKAVKEEDIRIIMQDVLEQEAIEGLCKRLKVIQHAILEAEKEKNVGFLERDEEWERDEVYWAFAKSKNSRFDWDAEDYLDRAFSSRKKAK